MMENKPEEPPVIWPSDPDIIAKTEAYRQRIETYLKGRHMHPWDQEIPPVSSRIHVLDLNGGNAKDRAVQPHDPQTTWQELGKIVEKSVSSPNSRHMVLLEGMDPRMVDVVGVQLNIPPEFWLAHFSNHLQVFDKSMARKESQIYWRIDLPQRFRFEDDKEDIPDDDYEIFFGNCCRGWESLSDPVFNEKTFGLGSFWGTRLARGSWIFLFLMDPSDGFIYTTNRARRSISPTFKLLPPEEIADSHFLYVALGPSKNSAKRFHPLITPIWDILVEAHKESGPLHSNDLTSCTSTLQGAICTIWEAQALQEYETNVIWMANNDYIDSLNEIDPDQPDEILQISESISRQHRNMTLRRYYFQSRIGMIQSIMMAFGHDDPESTMSGCGIEVSEVSKRWRVIYNRYRWRDRTLASNMTMYSQHTAMAEAFMSKLQASAAIAQTKAAHKQSESANRLARSAGQLAKIATVAVPCTVSASILSMNGEFAAGERLFFVYWCVAIPMTLVLLCWIIYRDILAVIRRATHKIASDGVEAELG